MNNTMEYILCCAVREIVDPEIFHCGYRHSDIYEQYDQEILGLDFMEDMGFLTSKGRFVGRKEAKEIAEKCGQIILKSSEKFDCLASEMIY